MKKKKIILGLIILIAICVIAFMLIDLKTPVVVAQEEGEIRVISYNLKNAYSEVDKNLRIERIKKVSEQIKTYNPDILCIQEADSPWMGEDIMNEWSSGLPVYLENYAFVGSSRQDVTGEYAPIFYLKNKYELIDSGTFWLSDTPDKPSLTWNSDIFERICTWATLRNKITGEVHTYLNTHFDTNKISKENSAVLILSKINEIETPVILAGDFNFLQGSKNYDLIVNSNLEDSKKNADKSMNFGTINYFYNVNTKFFPVIDFVFYSKEDFYVKRYQIDNNYKFNNDNISDHHPVIVDFLTKDY